MRHRIRRSSALVALVVGALVAAPAAASQSSPITIELSGSAVDFGAKVTVTGTAGSEAAGREIVLQQASDGAWLELGRAVAESTGSFALSVRAERSGAVRAVDPVTGAASESLLLDVSPVVRVKAKRGAPYLGARVTVRIRPATYAGRASMVIRQGNRILATASGTIRAGLLRTKVPTPAVGSLVLALTLAPTDELSGRVVQARLRSAGRTLSVGSTGPDVRALAKRLAELRIRVPGLSSSFGYELYDSVVAFQKAYRLDRTGTVGPQTWRKLVRAEPLRPRFKGPAAHIEVDKTRQILMDVRNGKVVAVLPTSTGATGNTPEGKHAIRWKAPSTTTWLGPGILYRTLTFYGDSFAIHGWSSVPVYPASHGCVRIPIWTADWLYNRSPVGQTVYVYR